MHPFLLQAEWALADCNSLYPAETWAYKNNNASNNTLCSITIKSCRNWKLHMLAGQFWAFTKPATFGFKPLEFSEEETRKPENGALTSAHPPLQSTATQLSHQTHLFRQKLITKIPGLKAQHNIRTCIEKKKKNRKLQQTKQVRHIMCPRGSRHSGFEGCALVAARTHYQAPHLNVSKMMEEKLD